jgi:hypothetical protein
MSDDVRKELADYWDADGEYADFGGLDRDDAVEKFLSRNIVIPRSELPAVKRATRDENVYYVGSENICFTSVENARKWVMADIAVWQFIEHEASVLAVQEAEKTAARDKRRDDLARDLVKDGAYAYRFADDPLKLAIDRIIDLEAASNV